MAEEYDTTVDELEWTADSLNMSVDEMMDLVRSTGIHPDRLQDAFDYVGELQFVFGEGNVIKGLLGGARPLTDEDRRRKLQPERLIPDEGDVVVDFSEDAYEVSCCTENTCTGSAS
jgi:hypothetical protein